MGESLCTYGAVKTSKKEQTYQWRKGTIKTWYLVCAGKHAEAGALMTICTGACWSPARLLEEGIITAEEAKCPLCGHPEADEGRLFWECPRVMEARHPAIQKSNRFCAEYSRCRNDSACRSLYWRGLVSEQETTPIGQIYDTADILKPISECQDNKVTVFIDGSGGKRTKDKRLRRCGWAWVVPV